MNNSNSEGLVTLSRSKASLVYDINEKNLFSPAGFKMLQSNVKKGFVKCGKSSINGKIRLTYDISRFVTLQEAMSGIYSKQYLVVAYNMLLNVVELRDMEFVQRENISFDPRDIFVDPQTLKIYFIYLPIARKSSPSAHIMFEKNVRKLLAEFVQKNQKGMSSFAMQISRELINFQINTLDIVKKLEIEAAMTTTAEVSAGNSGELCVAQKLETTAKDRKADNNAFSARHMRFAENDTPQEAEFKEVFAGEKRIVTPTAEKEINDLLKNMSQKSYNSTNPNNRRMVERTVKKEKKKMKKETASKLIFFACYFPILFIAMFVILNYYRNSGMSGGFVFFIVATLMFVLMAPVIFFTRKSDKNKKSEVTLYEQYNSSVRGGFKPIVIVSVSNAATMEFFVNKEEYILGKMPGLANGVIPFDKTVSDAHCKIVWNNGFFIQDLNSDYGTFVDEIRVVPGQNFPIKNGNKIKISKNVFEVRET